MEFSKSELTKLLLDTYDYPRDVVDVAVEQLLNMSEIGKQSLKHLIETRNLPDIECNGISLNQIKKQKPDHSDIALIIIFDGFIRMTSKL